MLDLWSWKLFFLIHFRRSRVRASVIWKIFFGRLKRGIDKTFSWWRAQSWTLSWIPSGKKCLSDGARTSQDKHCTYRILRLLLCWKLWWRLITKPLLRWCGRVPVFILSYYFIVWYRINIVNNESTDSVGPSWKKWIISSSVIILISWIVDRLIDYSWLFIVTLADIEEVFDEIRCWEHISVFLYVVRVLDHS